MRLARKAGIILWNALATLPVASGITGAVGAAIEVGNESRAEWGWLEIWRADLVKAAGTLTLAANATRANALGTLTLTGGLPPIANETVTIDGVVYTWKASVTTTANQVKIGVDADTSLANLIAAITAGSGSGTVYGSSTVVHPTVTAAAGSTGTMVVTAKASGTSGNALATTETMTTGSWGGTTLASGAAAETATLDTHAYSFVNYLSGVADQVLIGATASDTLDNLIAAVNGAAGSGTLYGTGTVAHSTVDVAAGAGDTMTVAAKTAGTAGNSIATTETMAQGSFGATTLTGGLDQSTTDSTITGPITLWGYNGVRWLSISVVSSGNLTVNGVRGAGYFLRGMGVYSRLALTAANATPSGTAPTISATYSPVFSHE